MKRIARFLYLFFAAVMLCTYCGTAYAADSIKEREKEYREYKQQYLDKLIHTLDQAALDEEYKKINPEFWNRMKKEMSKGGEDVSPSGPGGTQYEIKNDGMAMKADDIYKESNNIPSSFKGAEYYDVAYPYNLTPYDIGGYVIKETVGGVDQGFGYNSCALDDEGAKKEKITAVISHEWSTSYLLSDGDVNQAAYAPISSITPTIEESTGLEIRTVNGVQFYTTAIQKFPYNNSKALEWWGDMDSGFDKIPTQNFRAYVFDIILTDGTVIHFMVGDANHPITNGYQTGEGAVDTYMNKDKAWYFGPMKLDQYRNSYGITKYGNVLELWGNENCASGFQQKYNIGSGDGQNRIAYYRMYNLSNADSSKIVPAAEGVKSVDYKLGSVSIKKSDGTEEKKENPDGLVFGQTGIYAETRFVDVEVLVENPLRFTTWEELTASQLKGIIDWRENIKSKEGGIVRYLRIAVMIAGIAMLVWTVLIYMAYWFDRVNNFVDIDVLPIVTFGRLRVSPDESDCTFGSKGGGKDGVTVNHKAIAGVCAVGLFMSVLVVSGTLYTLMEGLVLLVLGWVGVK